MINSKTLSRICAVQVLYIYFFEEEKISLDTIKDNIISLYKSKIVGQEILPDQAQKMRIKINMGHLDKILTSTLENISSINDHIKKMMASDEMYQRQSPLMMALLQVAAAEMIYIPDTPKKVVMDEFTNIASSMLSDADIGIVNAVIDKINTG